MLLSIVLLLYKVYLNDVNKTQTNLFKYTKNSFKQCVFSLAVHYLIISIDLCDDLYEYIFQD